MLQQDIISNDSNLEFYDKIDIEKFKEFTLMTGFDNCPDIELLKPFWQNKSKVVELGAGYGRVIDYLLEQGFAGEIYGVERVQAFVEYMQQKFKNAQQVKILKQDIKVMELPTKVDLLLWMWSAVMEMSPSEILLSLQNLRRQVEPGTVVAIDLPDKKIKVVGQHESEKIITLKTDWGTLRAYFPEEAEIFIKTKKAGFCPLNTLRYQTHKGLERVIYLFEAA
jgi:SAM-dependent methyltransferase